MSSHHIVKDNQEPALIIANGQECSKTLLEELLEWSPFIIVLDAAITRAIEYNIKIDAVLGDFDRGFSPSKYYEQQYPLEIVHTPDQDKTDLEKAFDYLIDKGHTAVNVVWATGKRTDHTLANITTLVRYKDVLKIVLIDDYSKIFLLSKTFKKWYPKGSLLSLMPIGTVTGITTSNLFYPLADEVLQLGYRNGNSNHTVQDGMVTISYKTGDLLLIEATD